MAEVMIDGVWLHSLGHVADVKWSTTWGAGPCGPALASCTVAVAAENDSSLLRLARTFQVWDDGVLRFGGVVSEPGAGYPRVLSAKGWAHRARDFDSLDASNNPIMNPQTAVTQAIARGLPWSNPTAFTNVALGPAGGPAATRLDKLLDDWAVTATLRWGVSAEGVAFASADPTEPTWFLDASDLPLGVADDGLYTRVVARYVTSLDADNDPSAWSTVVVDDTAGQALYGVIEYQMDLTPLGILPGTPVTTATGYAQAQLNLLTVPQWLSRVTTNSGRLLTKGGLPAHLGSVQAGQMIRLFNVPNTLGGLRNELGVDVVLGEVEYDTANPSEVTIAPVGLAVRNLADLAAQAKRAADEAAAARTRVA